MIKLSLKVKLSFLIAIFFLLKNVDAQEWTKLNDTPFWKHHSNGFGIGDKAYVLAGVGENDNPNISTDFWMYESTTDTWTQLDGFPGQARAIAIGDDWNGKYYYGFGSSGLGPDGPDGGVLTDLWEFDPATMEFTQLPSCPCQGRTHPGFVAHNDKIFMGSGSTFDGDLKDWWEYDMITQVWAQKTNIPGASRHHPFQFAIDNMVYIGGGHESTWSGYDIETGNWISINNFPEGRVAGTQFSYNGKGYALSGDDYLHRALPQAETFLEYDPATDFWTELTPHPSASRWAPSSFIIDGAVYLFGGYDNSDFNDRSLYKYQLGEPTSTETIVNDTNIDVYPNPFQDVINIDISATDIKDAQVEIFNSIGQSVYRATLTSPSVDLTSLQSGAYLIKVTDINEKTVSSINVVKM